MKKIAIYALLVIGMITSCKDKEPITPKPDPSNNEYTVKVKIINGTTGKTLYTTSKMHLRIERKYGLGHIDDELLGSAYMDEDGGIEITYKHSAMGDMSGATAILYGGPWAVGFHLPPNQNVDTSIYRSTWGTVVLHLIDVPPYNKMYYAYSISSDSLISDSSDINESRFINIRCTNLGFGFYHDIKPIEVINGRISGNPKSLAFRPTGDPFIDTLRIEY
jgi:hypothetical protein